LTAKPPDRHEQAELATLQQAYDSIFSQANEANFKSWSSNANVYANWAAQLQTSIANVRLALEQQSSETLPSAALPTSRPPTLPPTTSSKQYSSTQVVTKTQMAADEFVTGSVAETR
jgi:hypothetical protein